MSDARTPRLRLVRNGDTTALAQSDVPAREVDWSILMARAQSGDAASYRRLLDEISPYLRSLARRRFSRAADVEDAVQDILLSVHAVRATYDPARPFAGWLTAIAQRRIVDQLRRKIRLSARENADGAAAETIVDQYARTDRTVDNRALQTAVAQLTDGQREAVRLLKLEERSLAEASALSGLSEGH